MSTLKKRTADPVVKRKYSAEIPHSLEISSNSKNLLLELSIRMGRIASGDTDNEIKTALDLIANTWGLDCILLVLTAGENSMPSIFWSHISGDKLKPSYDFLARTLPWFTKQLLTKKTIAMPTLPDDLPVCAVSDREYCGKKGIKSVFIKPLTSDTKIVGTLLASSFGKIDPCSREMSENLNFLSEILANTLSRKKTAEDMEEILAFERLLSDISATYINLPADNINKMMRNDLGRLGSILGADRCIMYLADTTGKIFKPYLYSGWWPDEDTEAVIRRHTELIEGDPAFINDLEYLFDKWHDGEPVQWTQLDKLSESGQRMKKAHDKLGTKSQLSIPISMAGSIVGVLTISDTRLYRTWRKELIPRLRLFGEVFANALQRKQSQETLEKAFSEIKNLKERLEADNVYLRKEVNLGNEFKDIVGKSNIIKQILMKVRQVAPTNANVLLLGETGTGKGLFARAIHNESIRRDRPFMQVNCAALAPSLIESELFGHEKGAFTGAALKRIGRFEAAHGTTLFLDEVGELSSELQAKLLRVLQDGEFERVGGSAAIKTDVRIIAATNRNLEKEVETGRFRQDLWYRLSTFPIHIPPLRQRLEDIPLFLEFFINKYSKWMGKRFDMVSRKTIQELQRYSWPGNIRELENVIERAVITSPEGHLRISVPSLKEERPMGDTTSFREFEKKHILAVLGKTKWKIEGSSGAAQYLGLKPSTLRSRMARLGIKRPVYT